VCVCVYFGRSLIEWERSSELHLVNVPTN